MLSNPAAGNPVPAGPLAGLRVLEISSFVAAPLGGMTLAQLGADVIRVDPLGGAADRYRWPRTVDGTSLYWTGLNKGKRSVMVDFRSAEGRRVITDLLTSFPSGSAVVLTNAVGRQWLSYEALREHAPDLVHVQVEGRSDGTPAVDYTVNAEVGFPFVTGPAGLADPVNHVLPAWDIACGLYAALGVSAAARNRERTGEGESLSVALADVALAMAGNLGFLAEAQLNNVERQRIGNYLYGGFARDFTSRDGGRFMVVALTSRHWADMLRLTGMERAVAALERELDVDFALEDDRFEYREALAGLFGRWFSRHTAAEVSDALAATALVWAPYRTFQGAVEHLQTPAGHNPIVTEIDQPGVGPHLAPGSPLTVRSMPSAAEPAPLLGEHTHDVLADELALDESQIARLYAAGAVESPAVGGQQ